MKHLKRITAFAISSCILFGCIKNDEYNGITNIIVAKANQDVQLASSYFAIGTIPIASESKDTTLVTTGVVLTGIPAAKQDISVKIEIDTMMIKALIDQANDASVPDANKSAQVLAYKGTALIPADCFDLPSLDLVIPKEGRFAPLSLVFHKDKLARLGGKTKYVLPFKILTAMETINSDRALCIFSLRLIKPKPIITAEQYDNIALNKAVTVSSINSASEAGPRAVDGNKVDNTSRWVTLGAGAHFIEIDLGDPVTVSGFATWYGATGYNNPQTQFNFQVFVDNKWMTVESETTNTDPRYASIITPVVTRRVRYNVPAYANNTVRMYEIEVYKRK